MLQTYILYQILAAFFSGNVYTTTKRPQKLNLKLSLENGSSLKMLNAVKIKLFELELFCSPTTQQKLLIILVVQNDQDSTTSRG